MDRIINAQNAENGRLKGSTPNKIFVSRSLLHKFRENYKGRGRKDIGTRGWRGMLGNAQF